MHVGVLFRVRNCDCIENAYTIADRILVLQSHEDRAVNGKLRVKLSTFGLDGLDKYAITLLEEMGTDLKRKTIDYLRENAIDLPKDDFDFDGRFRKELDRLRDEEEFDYLPESYEDLQYYTDDVYIEDDYIIVPFISWASRGSWDYPDGLTHSFGNWEETKRIEDCCGSELQEHITGSLEEIEEIFSFLVDVDANNFEFYRCYEFSCRDVDFFKDTTEKDFYICASVHI